MRLWRCVVWCLFAHSLLLGNPVFGADSIKVERIVPEIRALRINPHPPIIDGDLTDPVWTDPNLPLARGFTQREPDDGKAATESTGVAVRYDDDAIYVAFWCYDSQPEKIAAQLVRRDRSSESDMVSVCLDPFHDHQSGYEFVVSAANVQTDYRIYNDDGEDASYDGVWTSGVKRQPWGWSAEVRIPYHCLRFSEQPEQTWGVDFARMVNRKKEYSKWAFTPASEGGFASKFGHLTGLSVIKPARHVEILPYVVSKAQLAEKSRGNPDGRSVFGNTGVDVKYGISSNLTLDATVNPDFGQVELDQPVLNLSAFETFFAERRPFFIEGSDLLNTDFMMFYSRRIGRAPRGSVNDPQYDYLINRPMATTILGAAKLTGKLAGRTSIEILSAVTQEEKEKYRATTGEVRRGSIEPAADYSVLRIKQDIFKKSSVGGIFTLAGQDARHPAATGGADWRLYTNDGGWCLNGQTVFSRTDPEHTGFGLTAGLQKMSGKHWRGSAGITIKDPHLDIWRMGFTQRNNLRTGNMWIQYRTQDDWWIIRNSYNNFNFNSSWNYNGDNVTRYGNFNTNIEFLNNWTLGGGFEVQGEKCSDVETRGNGLWQWPVHPTYSAWLSLNTDTRKRISFNINPGGGTDRGGTWWANYIGVQYRPKSNLEFSGGVNYNRAFNGTRWVENRARDTTVFADLDRDEVYLELTAGVMLTRNLSWQISGQGLISSLDYHDYKRYLGGNEYVRDIVPRPYDGTFSSLNSMMLLRWEYIPGSTLYFVWTRERPQWDGTVANLDFTREFDRFFSRGATNIWLLKASYWWNI